MYASGTLGALAGYRAGQYMTMPIEVERPPFTSMSASYIGRPPGRIARSLIKAGMGIAGGIICFTVALQFSLQDMRKKYSRAPPESRMRQEYEDIMTEMVQKEMLKDKRSEVEKDLEGLFKERMRKKRPPTPPPNS